MKRVIAFLFLSIPVFAQDTTFTKEDPNLTSIAVTIYSVDSQGGLRELLDSVKKYKNGDLQRLLVVGVVSRDDSYEHIYGVDGKISERVERDENNEPTRTWLYHHRPNGSWVMDGYGYDENGDREVAPIYIERWSTDGKILSAEWKMEGYKTTKVFSYDKDGRLEKMEETPEGASKPISWEVYKYNDAGKLATKEVYTGEILKETTSYGDRGDKMEVVRHDGKGVAYTKSVFTYVYKDFGGGERKAEELSTSYNLKKGEWVKGSVLKVAFDYKYKEKKK
ncbi:MAG: hypothetical protein AAB389_03145 [Patescibacteria group bacterium]